MNIAFIHIRRWKQAKGYLEKNWNSLLDNYGGVTIAYHEHRIGDSIIAEYAVAECCETDRFCKEIGRQISVTRLHKSEVYGSVEVPADMGDALQEAIVEDYLCTRAEIIEKESANGEWIKDIDMRDFWQPVNPGYVWNEELQDE